MAKTGSYPVLEINTTRIFENTKNLVDYAKPWNIGISAVIKGFTGTPKIVEAMIKGGCRHIASSRIEQLAELRKRGVEIPLMLIRIPMFSELHKVVCYSDISLNSEAGTIAEIEKECCRQNKAHGVVLMADLGDLREGFFDRKELVDLALFIENNYKYVRLMGVGTNLGCYGAVRPTAKNLGELCSMAEEIESKIGRKLDIVSGGATSSISLLLNGAMPKGINNLRVGEAILLNRDLPDYWKIPVPFLSQDAFILKAQVVEVKRKPSHPVGEMFVDAFGKIPSFEDHGIRKRALLAVGKQDFALHDCLIPKLQGVEIMGSSSDHLIVDIEECPQEIKVGDVLDFGMFYPPMLYLNGSKSVRKVYIK